MSRCESTVFVEDKIAAPHVSLLAKRFEESSLRMMFTPWQWQSIEEFLSVLQLFE